MFEIVIEKIETGPNTWAKSKASFHLNGEEIISFERCYPSYPHVILYDEEVLRWKVYHSPSSYMKWAVTTVYSNGHYEHVELGGLSWADVTLGDLNKDRTTPIICFAGFKATPDQKHLFISGCSWGGPYYEFCFNIEEWRKPKFISSYDNYDCDELDRDCYDACIIETHNDYCLMETDEKDDEDRPLNKLSLCRIHRGDTPYIITQYGQYTVQFKWYFLKTNPKEAFEFVSKNVAPDSPCEAYEREGWRQKIWPLDTPDEEITADDKAWIQSQLNQKEGECTE